MFKLCCLNTLKFKYILLIYFKKVCFSITLIQFYYYSCLLWPYLAIFSVRTDSTTCLGSTSPTLVERSSSDSLLPSIPSCWISRSNLPYCRSCTACTTASSRQLTATTTSSGPTSTSRRSITSCWISRQGWYGVIGILSVHWKVIVLRISHIELFTFSTVSMSVTAGDTIPIPSGYF